MSTITIHLSLTSSPSTPRSSLILTPTTASNELRTKVSQQTNVPLDKLKLIFRGRMINAKEEGGSVIEEYKLEEGSVIHVMGKPAVIVNNSNNNSAVNSSSNNTTINQAAAGASVTLPNNNNNNLSSSATASATSSGSVSGAGALEAAITKLRSQNDGTTFRTALTTADKLLGNIINNPMEEKYRSIKKSNPAFAKRLGSLNGGHELLLAAGFTITTKDDSIEYYTLVPSETAWPTLVKSKEEVGKLLLSESSNQMSATSIPSVAGGLGGGWDGTGIPPSTVTGGLGAPGSGLPSFGSGMGGQQPDMAQMQSMLSDPNMMQRVMGMANNPMVQQMMQNDPRFANNPQLQQSLQALQSNPDLMNQMSSMMANPQARQHMASMVAQQAATAQQQQQQGGGAAAGSGTDSFANGMRDQFQQMQNQAGGGLTPEQLQQMMSQFTTSGTAPANGNSGGGNSTTTNNNNTSNGGSSGNASSGNENEMTEEEMINEAIARSLRES